MRARAVSLVVAGTFLAAAWIGPVNAAGLDGGTSCAFELQQATVPVTFSQSGGQVAALQFDLLYDQTALTPATPIYVGVSDHLLESNVVVAGQLRILLHSATNSLVPDGLIVQAPFTVSPATPGGPLPLPLSTTVLATIGTANLSPTSNVAGEVEVAEVLGPIDTTVCNGASASLDVAVTGPGIPTYQWKKTSVDLPGETSASLGIAPVEFADIALYSVDVSSSSCGMATSRDAILNVAGVCEPTQLSAYDPGVGGALNLTWMPNPSSDVNGYRLLWGTDEAGPYPFQRDLGVTATDVVSSLTGGTRYYFKAIALIDAQQSLFSNEANAVPTAGGLDLPQATEYGYQAPTSLDISHPDVVTYRFPPRQGDATLWYDVYDIGIDEASISLNGVSVLASVAPTLPGNWASPLREVVLPDNLVLDSEPNVLTFDNLLHPAGVEETWAARNVSIKLPAPQVAATAWSQTVDVVIAQSSAEPSLAGFDVYRGQTPGFPLISPNRIAASVQVSLYRDESGLVNDQAYYYVIRPVDTISNPGFASTEVSATPSDVAVTPVVDLRVGKSGVDDLGLVWSNVVTEQGVLNYKIFEGATPGSVIDSGSTTVAPAFTSTGDQSDGLSHFYLIIAVDGLGRESTP